MEQMPLIEGRKVLYQELLELIPKGNLLCLELELETLVITSAIAQRDADMAWYNKRLEEIAEGICRGEHLPEKPQQPVPEADIVAYIRGQKLSRREE